MRKRRWGLNVSNPASKHTHKSRADDEDDDLDDLENSDIEVDENHIYFYSDIDRASSYDLIRKIRETDTKFALRRVEMELKLGIVVPSIPLHLHICSNGGEIKASFAIADVMRKTKCPVHTCVEGTAASGATIISTVGRVRSMLASSNMLIHQLSTGMYGTYADLIDEKEACDKWMDALREHYRTYTTMDESTLQDLLKRDLWLTADECLEYGLVDEVIK